MGTAIVDAAQGISDASFVGLWALLWGVVVMAVWVAFSDY
jgi:hypothetical protein